MLGKELVVLKMAAVTAFQTMFFLSVLIFSFYLLIEWRSGFRTGSNLYDRILVVNNFSKNYWEGPKNTSHSPVAINLFNVNNENTRTMC